MTARRPHALFLVQNLSLPMDRRVWQECQSIRDAGYTVSVICPRETDQPRTEIRDEIRIHRYLWPAGGRSGIGFAREFTTALVRMTVVAVRLALRDRFSFVQYCNPPDTMWLTARLLRLMSRCDNVVYDQHDLCPEIYLTRGGREASMTYRILQWFEQRAFSAADLVLFTNPSYKQRAIERGRSGAEQGLVLTSGPTDSMKPINVSDRAAYRRGKEKLVVYLGVMGPQDGVDSAVRALAELKSRGRSVHFAALGFGECLQDLQRLAVELGLTSNDITWTGRVDAQGIAEWLSAADAGVAPDPPNPLADISTHNKVLEYMAYGLPFAAFNLKETARVAAGVAVFASEVSPAALADALEAALDPEARRDRARRAIEIIDTSYRWERASLNYVAAVTSLPVQGTQE